jgi:hypothetical protein
MPDDKEESDDEPQSIIAVDAGADFADVDDGQGTVSSPLSDLDEVPNSDEFIPRWGMEFKTTSIEF